jgi:hypothetical protein
MNARRFARRIRSTHSKHPEDTSMTNHPQAPDAPAEHIELEDPFAAQVWAKKLNVSSEQLREAIEAVGDRAADVEMHLKGSRSTSNSDRVKQASGDKPR